MFLNWKGKKQMKIFENIVFCFILFSSTGNYYAHNRHSQLILNTKRILKLPAIQITTIELFLLVKIVTRISL